MGSNVSSITGGLDLHPKTNLSFPYGQNMEQLQTHDLGKEDMK